MRVTLLLFILFSFQITIFSLHNEMAIENETSIPESITIKSHQLKKGAKVRVLGTSKNLKWKNLKGGFQIEVPESFKKQVKSKYVWVIKVDGLEKTDN